MMPLLRWLCVLAVVVPVAVAPFPTLAREHLEEPIAAEEPAPPAETGPAAQTTTDAIHDEMVRSFIAHFQQGQLHYNRGAYALAAAEFEQAFASVAAEAALRNVSLSHERAGDDVAAAIAARRYLQLPSCDEPGIDQALCGSHREELEAALPRLLARVGELRLEIAKGVTLREIRINGRVTSKDDFPVLVAAGRVDIELQGGNVGQRRQRVIEIRAGEKKPLLVDSFDTPTGPIGPIFPGTPKPRGKWLRPAFWVGVGATAASGIALATTGALTIVAKDRFEREQRLHNENPPEIDENGKVGDPKYPWPADELARYQRFSKASNILVGVTAGVALVTIIVGVVAFTRPRNPSTTRASTRMRFQYTGSGFVMHY